MPPPAPLYALLPGDVVRTPAGEPAVLVVRTSRGWRVLGTDPVAGWANASPRDEGTGEDDALTLVEAMSLADLVAGELGASPEPDREARRAARTATQPPLRDDDPVAEEIAVLRRTVGQLEHALAARVSIERAIGVLAERHGTTPRQAFEQLRRRARSEGRPAQDLAAEVLDGLTSWSADPARQPAPGSALVSAPEPRPAGGASRRVQRPRRTGDGDTVPGARS